MAWDDFGGLVQRELDNHLREFLAVEYEGGGQLYVPVHQADRLTRYIGRRRRRTGAGSFGWAGVARKEGTRQAGCA